jgi:hypothetical protein
MRRNGLIVFLLLSGSVGASAQSYRNKPEPVREDFCLLMDKILDGQKIGYPGFADTVSYDDGDTAIWPVRGQYSFDQATCQLVTLPTGQTVYRAVFMTRDNKESIVASYKNLLAMVKECYGDDYVFKDKESKIRKVYECRAVPYSIDVNKEQAEMVVYIAEDWISRTYHLVLQVD